MRVSSTRWTAFFALAVAATGCGDGQRPVSGPSVADAGIDGIGDAALSPDIPTEPPDSAVAGDAAPATPCKSNLDCPAATEPCTESRCEAKTGFCKVVLATDGASCSDGQPCTVGDACLAGACVAGKYGCGCIQDSDCAAFEDGNACNGTWTCDLANQPSLCVPKKSSQVVCAPPSTPCLTAKCNPATGACDTTPTNDGGACDDGKVCTAGDHCAAGSCVPGADQCPCKANADCADDGNLCNGLPYCDKSELPWTCKTNPGTVASCSASGDTACSKNTCNTATGACAPLPVNEGAKCSDDDPCTASDTCAKGVCKAGPGICGCQSDGDCAKADDGDLCNGTLYCNKTVAPHLCQVNPATVVVCASATDTACAANKCVPATGKCAVELGKDGSPCSDDNPCTQGDGCVGGKCVGATNLCPCTQSADCAAKDDGNLCNGTLYCDKAKLPYVCAVNPATVVGCPSVADTACTKNLCSPTTGKCAMTAVNQAAACNADDNPCTAGDSCDSGQCKAGPANCPCQKDADCLPQEDGNPCNGNLYCDKASNQCKVNPSSVVVCSALGDGPCATNTCNPATGSCAPKFAAQGTTCDADANACTVGDTCQLGKCVAGANVCSCESDAGCAAYEDGNLCNGKLVCDKSALPFACKVNPATVVSCGTGVPPACQVHACNPATGKCGYVPVLEFSACEDGQACTTGDTCQGGKCVPGTDLCGCKADADCAAQEDGNLCNGSLYCDKVKLPFQCKVNPGTVVVCPTADDSACSKRVCQGATGQCPLTAVGEGSPCNDGDLCTTTETCKAGSCQGGGAVNCSDGDACTADDCDAVDGCWHLPNGAAACNDGDACTVDACDAKAGCSHNAVLGVPCNDGSACTASDTCTGKGCVGLAGGCDDDNPCTDDGCAADGASCTHSDNEAPCPGGRTCVAGRCGGCEAWRRPLRWGCELVAPGSAKGVGLTDECERVTNLNRETAEDAADLGDGRVVSVGAASTDTTAQAWGWAAWVSDTGKVLQQGHYGKPGGDRLLAVAARGGGSAWAAGTSVGQAGTLRPWLLGLDAKGKAMADVRLETLPGESAADTGGFDGVTATSDGGALAVGQLTHAKAGGTDALLAGFDATGKLLWTKVIGSESSGQAAVQDRLWAVAAARDGTGFVSAGHRGHAKSATKQQDGWLVKVDAKGNVLWSKTFGGDTWDGLFALTVGAKGDIAAVGVVGRPDAAGAGNGWWLRTDANGVLLAQTQIAGHGDDVLRAVAEHPAGGWMAGGLQNVDHAGDPAWAATYDRGHAWAVRLSEGATVVWQRTYDDLGDDQGLGGQGLPNGDLLLAGESRGSSTKPDSPQFIDKPDALLLRIDAAAGDDACPCQFFEQHVLGATPAALYGVATATAASFVASGDTPGAGGAFDGWLHAFDADGKVLWNKVLPRAGIDGLRGIARGANGTLLAVGFTASGGAGGQDGWAVAVDGKGKVLADKTFGGAGQDSFRAVTALPGGGWALAGSTTSGAVGGTDGWLVVLDGQFNPVGQLVHGYNLGDSLDGVAVVGFGSSARILAVGAAETSAGSRNALVALTDLQAKPVVDPASGKPVLYHFHHDAALGVINVAGGGDDFLTGLVRTPDGGAAAAGLAGWGKQAQISKSRFDFTGARIATGGHGNVANNTWSWAVAALADGTAVQVGFFDQPQPANGHLSATALLPDGSKRWATGTAAGVGFGGVEGPGGHSNLLGVTTTTNDQMVAVGWVQKAGEPQRALVLRFEGVRGAALGTATANTDDPQCRLALCDRHYGVLALPRSGPCSDNDACSDADLCSKGVCTAQHVVACDDGNVCTDDTCPGIGGCVAQATKASPQPLCTKTLTCSAGNCGPCALAETAWPAPTGSTWRLAVTGAPDGAGGAWLVGHTYPSGGAVFDSWVARADAKGAPTWQVDLKGADDDRLYGLVPQANGTAKVYGYRRQKDAASTLQYDEWIVTISAAGSVMADSAPVVAGDQRILTVRQTGASTLVGGVTAGKASLRFVDAAGATTAQWQAGLAGTLAWDVTQASDGSYAVVANDTSESFDRLALYKVSKDHQTLWQHLSTRVGQFVALGVWVQPSGAVLVVLGDTANGHRLRVVEVSAEGVLLADRYNQTFTTRRAVSLVRRGLVLQVLATAATATGSYLWSDMPALGTHDLQGNLLQSVAMPSLTPSQKPSDQFAALLLDLPGPTMWVVSAVAGAAPTTGVRPIVRVVSDEGLAFCGGP